MADAENDDNPLVISTNESAELLREKKWTSITIKEGLFNEIKEELMICDYPHVQYIYIEEQSYENVAKLTIANLPELRLIVVEDNSFYNTTSIVLQGTCVIVESHIDLPLLHSIITGEYSFSLTKSLYSLSIQSSEVI